MMTTKCIHYIHCDDVSLETFSGEGIGKDGKRGGWEGGGVREEGEGKCRLTMS
jgi:hypothetical protein